MTSAITQSCLSPSWSQSSSPSISIPSTTSPIDSLSTATATSSSSSSSSSINPSAGQAAIEPQSKDLLKTACKVWEGSAAISFTTPLVVSSFGPFHVVAGYHPTKAIVFLAHMNASTCISSLSNRLQLLNIAAGGSSERSILPEFQWFLAGGWSDSPWSEQRGSVILKELGLNQIPSAKIDLSKYGQKRSITSALEDFTDESLKPHLSFGAYISPREGHLREFTNRRWSSFDKHDAYQAVERIDRLTEWYLLQNGMATSRLVRDLVFAPYLHITHPLAVTVIPKDPS